MEEALKNIVYKALHEFPKERSYKIYTGTGGYDLFNENLERKVGNTERIYYGKKVMRLFRKLGTFYKSASGRMFRRVSIKK